MKSTPGSLGEALDALEADHDFLLRGDVFTKDVIETWIAYKREKEVDAIALRPHPLRVPPLLRHLARSSVRESGRAANSACSLPRSRGRVGEGEASYAQFPLEPPPWPSPASGGGNAPRYCAVQPPSIDSAAPVMVAAAASHR